ncbi:AMP-binding protein [Alloacidobacterium dinghuense]|uniref:AMP-binding protein n=1 Tax=Alloacidobacterium dinghuense TaxID=2763107 RepID=A0A7G8BIE5_9BACT|nr:AMP-binding protein [Alloacidobacterium dinghuense]QNI32315.1 AMP-binding protein [Alloacidobacterium dinghuense]
MRPHLATLVDDFRRLGNATAIVTYRGNRRLRASYADIASLAERFATELQRRDVHMGERVLLWGQNSAEWIGVFFGCVLRGVLVVPLDAGGGIDFARRVVAETSPKLIVGDQPLVGSLSEIVPKIVLDEIKSALPPEPDGKASEGSLSLDTPLQVIFTSGTTMEPKGVVHTHRNVLASVAPIEREMQKYLRYERLFHPLRFLHTLPLSHVFGQFMGLWLPVLLGAEVHFESRLQAQRLIDLTRSERISVLVAVPRVLDLLRSHLLADDPELKTQIQKAQGESVWSRWWRFRKVHRLLGLKFWAFVCGGASLPADLESFWSTIGFALIQGYGMTETTALVTLNHPFKIGKGTIGKPLPGREVRISDDGEILVRGDMISTSTWQRGKMQQAPDDWLATGDLARSDAQGQLQFLGRRSQVIVTSSGLNIHPEDVEAVLDKQDGVRASVVVPLETPSGNEAMTVLLFRGSEEEAAKAVRHASAGLSEYQRIRYWRIWPELDFPRTSTGKIQRGKVAEWAAAHAFASTVTSTDTNHDALADLISNIARLPTATAGDEARLDEDLHLDSLGRVQLQGELERRMGVALDDATMARIETLGDLRRSLGLRGAAAEMEPGVTSPAVASESNTTCERAVYPRWPWSLPMRAARIVFLECALRPLVWFLASPKVERLPNMTWPDAPFLIIANHITAYDAALVLYALPGKVRRRVAVAMAAEILDDFRHARGQGSWFLNGLFPVAYWLITGLFNVFPLPSSIGFRDSFAHMGKALDRGYNIMIFPEGHRSGGLLAHFRPGIGLLVQESDAEVVPVALLGLGELKQSRKRWFRSGKLSIRVGRSMQIDKGLQADEITSQLENTLRAMLK